MSRTSMRLRVAAAFALAMAVVLSGSGFFLYSRLGSHLSLALDRELQLRAQDVGSLVSHANASLAADSSSRFVERGESYAQLLDTHGRVLDATQPLGTSPLLTPSELRAARREPTYLERPAVPGLNEPSRLLATPLRRNGRPLVLVVGATLQDRAETLASFRAELLLAGPISLVLASLIGYLLAGLSLRQVEAMRTRAAAISADTPGERLPVPHSGDELERLAQTLNEMLARLEAALQREREFVADAGHELRTPLALLRTELELALHHAQSADELKDAVRRSSREADRLSQLAEDLLLIAQSDRGRLPLRREDHSVDDLFATLISRFDWRAQDEGMLVRAEPASGLSVHGDRLRLEQALGNLIDNALRYGAGMIRLHASNGDGQIALHVSDTGDGFPPQFLDRAFERFSRSDGARTSGGAGLGLSIVRAIAEAHGGTVSAANTQPNGADVWLTLPDRPT